MMMREELRGLQWAKLRDGLERILPTNNFYRNKFHHSGLTLYDLMSSEDLSKIPFTTKEEIVTDQQVFPPYGTNLSDPIDHYVRMHQTSGTSGRRILWLDTAANWSWILGLWSQIFAAAGVRAADRFFFPFSFGPFLGFWAAFEGACRGGHFTLAGGGMTTPARLAAILEHKLTVVCCTPTYALHMADVAQSSGITLADSAVRLLILAGEPGANIPTVRERLEINWGSRVIDHSGMTEIGSLGAEFEAHPRKLFLLEHDCIAEFIDPVSTEPVAEGELGEIVLTNLGRWGSPLIRYRTGDVGRWRAETDPALPYVYLEGGLVGRVDDMLWIKGNNVYPSTIESLIREHVEVAEFALEIDRSKEPATLTLILEPRRDADASRVGQGVETTFRDRLYFRPDIRLVEPDTLPRYELKARRIIERPTALPSDDGGTF